MRSGSLIVLCVFAANVACEEQAERPPPLTCAGCGTRNTGIYGGFLPPTDDVDGGAGSGSGSDEPVTLEGEVRILNDIVKPSSTRFDEAAALLVEGANGDVRGAWSGLDETFSLEGVKRAPAIWTEVTPGAGDALRTLALVDTSSPDDDGIVRATLTLARASEIDAAYGSLVSPLERSETAAQAILVALKDGQPASGVRAFAPGAEAIVYVENGVFNDMASGTDGSGIFMVANAPAGTVAVTLSGQVTGAYNLVLVSGGVTLARVGTR